MKEVLTLMTLACAFAVQKAAAEATTNTITTATSTTAAQAQPPTATQTKVEPPNAQPADRSQIIRFEGLSSQAWTTIAIRQPNPTAFHDAREHEPQLAVCLIGQRR